MSDNKSQISMEFIFLIGFVFIFSLAFIAAAGIQMQEFSKNKRIDTIDDFGYSLKKEIDIASVVEDGYTRSITLPEKIDGLIDYTISITNSTLVISTQDYEFARVSPKTKGSLNKGQNIIKKMNGSVIIENV